MIKTGKLVIRENTVKEKLFTDSESNADIIVEEIAFVTGLSENGEIDPCETRAEPSEANTGNKEEAEQIELEEPMGAVATSSTSITLNVNQQKTLHLDIESDEIFVSGLWNSNSSELSLRTTGGSSCTVKALAYSPLVLVVDCEYYCLKSYTIAGRKYTHTVTHYASYTININKENSGNGDGNGNDGITGNYTISSSALNVNMDMTAEGGSVILTSGVNEKNGSPLFSSAWTGDWNGNSHDIAITGNKAGTRTLVIYLKDSKTRKMIDSGEIEVIVEQETILSDNGKVPVSDCTLRLLSTIYTYLRVESFQ